MEKNYLAEEQTYSWLMWQLEPNYVIHFSFWVCLFKKVVKADTAAEFGAFPAVHSSEPGGLSRTNKAIQQI